MTGTRGSATVEQVGLILLATLGVAGLGIFLSMPGMSSGDRGLATRIANRIACGPALPGPCRSHPARDTYGPSLGRALRYFAPAPTTARDSAGQSLLPVDFRYCRRASCAVPDPGRPELDLTRSNRRTTMFTEVSAIPGGHRLTWWLYRPGMPWGAIHKTVTRADLQAAAGTRLALKDSPRLVPLEALDGRNHTAFRSSEMPPWLWRTPSSHDSRMP